MIDNDYNFDSFISLTPARSQREREMERESIGDVTDFNEVLTPARSQREREMERDRGVIRLLPLPLGEGWGEGGKGLGMTAWNLARPVASCQKKGYT